MPRRNQTEGSRKRGGFFRRLKHIFRRKEETIEFWDRLVEKNWEEAYALVHHRSSIQSPAEALLAVEKLYSSPTIPPKLIRALFVKMEELFPMRFVCEDGHLYQPFVLHSSVSTLKTAIGLLREKHPYPYLRRKIQPRKSNTRKRIAILWEEFLLKDTGVANREASRQSSEVRLVDESSQQALLSVTSLEDLKNVPEVDLLWQKTELLLKNVMESSTSSKDGEWLVTHIAAEVGLPSIVMWLALRLYPEQIHQRGSHAGWLPLHHAAVTVSYSMPQLNFRFTGELTDANEDLIQFLLLQFPEGAKYAANDGALPIALAIESLARVKEERLQAEVFSSRILPLVKAAPECLATRDTLDPFWPFLQAAAHGCSLETVYELLSLNPAVLNFRNPATTEKGLHKSSSKII